AGMVQAAGGLVPGIDETAALLGATGRVLPATTERVVLKALGARGEVNGQVAVSRSRRIEQVSLDPGGCLPPEEALAAIARADQIVVGPGSLYTSVLAAAAVEGIAWAISAARAQRVYVCNLRPQVPETQGYGVAEHVAALHRHGVVVDVVLWDPSSGMEPGAELGSELGTELGTVIGTGADRPGTPVVARPLSAPNRLVHDPGRLAAALSELLESSLVATSTSVPTCEAVPVLGGPVDPAS
ncbi:MAG: gluconeogenesis factor YvcK family protein, partial [Acidimicrobiales bacterium]